MRVLSLVFLLILSFNAFSDSYPAVDQYQFTYSPYTYSSYTNNDGGLCSQIPSSTNTITAGAGYPSATCKVTNNSTGNVTYLGISSAINKTCPSGGTLGSNNGVFYCNNVAACSTGQIRDAMGACYTPPVSCGADEYNDGSANGGVCKPIPKCNEGHPDGYYFFDMATKACQLSAHVGGICIGSTYSAYCPPYYNCLKPTDICSNNPDAVTNAAAKAATEKAAAAADAAAKKDEIDKAAKAASAAAESRAAAAADARQKAADAAAALAAAKAANDQAAISKAIKDYAAALDAQKDASARASNSQAASDGITQTNVDAGNEQAQIPGSNSGNARTHDDNISGMMPGLQDRLRDALAGDGNGSGRGSGVVTSSSPSTDTSGLAKEGTLEGIANGIQGINDKLGQGNSFSAGGNVHGNGKADGKGSVSSVLCSGDCGASPSCATGHCSPSERIGQFKSLYSLDSSASGECPAIEIDLSGVGFGNHSVSSHCALMESVRTPVTVIMTIVNTIGFIFILMSA